MNEQAARGLRGPCDHTEALDRARACRHLAGPLDREVTFYRWLTGVGLDAELLCVECMSRRERGEAVEIVSICDDCRAVVEDQLDPGGFRGEPGIRVRPVPVDATIHERPLPWPAEEIVDVAPIEAARTSWLVLLRDGSVERLDADSADARRVCAIELPADEPGHKPWAGRRLTPRLHTSSDAGFAAVVHDYGKRGRVYDLGTGRCTLELDGGRYHSDTVPFSLALVEHRERTVVIHRTAWNRLDASDAATGELLTDRHPTSYGVGEEAPEHYLDYFHGRLLVSPDGRRIVDDGWVWHPVGIPMVWDLAHWLDSNVWESEDGASRTALAFRNYYWDSGMCWLDSERIALGGIGEDEDWMLDGARIFTAARVNVTSRGRRLARELGAFAGPGGSFFGDGSHLFSTGGDALNVWDVQDGALLTRIEGFTPSRQHSHGRTLLELAGPQLRLWRY